MAIPECKGLSDLIPISNRGKLKSMSLVFAPVLQASRLIEHSGFHQNSVYWVHHLRVSVHTELLSIWRKPKKPKRKIVTISSHCFVLLRRIVCKRLHQLAHNSLLSLCQHFEPDTSKPRCTVQSASHPKTACPLQTNCSQFTLGIFSGLALQAPTSLLSSRQTGVVCW